MNELYTIEPVETTDEDGSPLAGFHILYRGRHRHGEPNPYFFATREAAETKITELIASRW